METSRLETIRHDLKNIMTGLESGCRLVGARVGSGDPVVHEYLAEMRTRIDRAFALLDQLSENAGRRRRAGDADTGA